MRKIMMLIFCFLLAMSFMCRKEDEVCHRSIDIVNQSMDTVVYALRFTYDDLCALQGIAIAPGETYTESLRSCWEHVLTDGERQEIYIAAVDGFNNPDTFYACDSIAFKNTILRHWEWALEDLQNSGFKVIYQ